MSLRSTLHQSACRSETACDAQKLGLEGRQARWRYELALLQRVQFRLRRPNTPVGDARRIARPCLRCSKTRAPSGRRPPRIPRRACRPAQQLGPGACLLTRHGLPWPCPCLGGLIDGDPFVLHASPEASGRGVAAGTESCEVRYQ